MKAEKLMHKLESMTNEETDKLYPSCKSLTEINTKNLNTLVTKKINESFIGCKSLTEMNTKNLNISNYSLLINVKKLNKKQLYFCSELKLIDYHKCIGWYALIDSTIRERFEAL